MTKKVQFAPNKPVFNIFSETNIENFTAKTEGYM